ncbi:secretin N-terminal domain-containing protein [Novosphingobium sp.]|uniref:type II secretion system protein GspD n=1 Tax=Novosphingobium sp. TaxID=1874826 RepID=UPI0033421C96
MGWLSRLPALALLLTLALGLVPGHVLAQTADLRPDATPALLTAIQLISQSPTEARFRLTLAPHANGFAPLADTPESLGKPALALALTTRASSAGLTGRLDGLVRAVRFEQVDSVLIIRFAATAAAVAEAHTVDPATLDITVHATALAHGAALPTRARTPANPPPADDADAQSELVMLKYADVSEVVGLISPGAQIRPNDHFIPREPGFGSTSLTGGSYAAQVLAPGDAPDQPLGESVDASGTIAIDRRLNAIWLHAPPARIARLKAQIALIDVPLDSVILDTELVELTESGARSVGIDFANASGQIALFSVQSGQFIPSGESPNNAGRLASGQLQAAISAQITKGNGKIVSRPRIAALSGATAKIITGDALPILTSITLSGVNGVSQQVQYVNVGVTLQIAPRVGPDGAVTSHVFCVVSSVTGYAQGYPTISQREAETVASVHDGESFVIGGLTQETVLDTRTHIPLLGDIPLIGKVFGTTTHAKQKTDLYIVVTPHILRHRG